MKRSSYNELKNGQEEKNYLISRSSLGNAGLQNEDDIRGEGNREYIDIVREKNKNRVSFEEEMGHYSQVTEFGFDIKE